MLKPRFLAGPLKAHDWPRSIVLRSLAWTNVGESDSSKHRQRYWIRKLENNLNVFLCFFTLLVIMSVIERVYGLFMNTIVRPILNLLKSPFTGSEAFARHPIKCIKITLVFEIERDRWISNIVP